MGVDYGWEKFYSAMRYAAGSSESVQERLAGVIMQISILDREHFSDDEHWATFEKLIEDTTKRAEKYPGEGTIHATTSEMSDEEAKTHLRDAFDLYNDMAWSFGAEKSKHFKQ